MGTKLAKDVRGKDTSTRRTASVKVYEEAFEAVKDRQYVCRKQLGVEPNQADVIGEALEIAEAVGWEARGIKGVPQQYEAAVRGLLRLLSADPSKLDPHMAAAAATIRVMLERYR